VLAKNTRLKELVADRNDFEGRRLRVLREFLAGNGGLQLLSLNQCNLGEDGAAYIAQGLGKNRRLRTLLLSNNQLGDRGLQMIADSIEYSSLEHLDLSKN